LAYQNHANWTLQQAGGTSFLNVLAQNRAGPKRSGASIRSKNTNHQLNKVQLVIGKSFKIWCGEGDLNPHEIAPASTSKYLTGFPGVACSCVVKRLRTSELPGISLFFANTLTKPLTVSARANDPYAALCAVKRCQLRIACSIPRNVPQSRVSRKTVRLLGSRSALFYD